MNLNISSLLTEKTIVPDLLVKDKSELLNRLVDLLNRQLEPAQLEAVRRAIFEREEVMSTGVGKGLAIPHGKAAEIDRSYASFALLAEPVEYEAIDGVPVRIVFLLAGPDRNQTLHIKLLSRISRLMNRSAFRERLLECATSGEILDLFRQEEEHYFQS